MEGQKLPAGQVRQSFLTVGIQFLQTGHKPIRIGPEQSFVLRITCSQTDTEVLHHLRCPHGVQPNMGVIFVVVFMVEALYLFVWDSYLANYFKG